VSTILEAQRQLEQRGAPAAAAQLPKRRWPLAAVAAGLTAGAVASALFLAGPEPPQRAKSPMPIAPAGSEAAPAAPAAPVAAVPPPPAPAVDPRANEERPWGRVHARKESPEERPAPETKQRSAERAAAGDASSLPGERAPGTSVVLPEGPLVTLRSIDCSGGRQSCSAELSVDGRTARVYQGEAWQGVEIQLILPDAVYVRQGGTVLALRAR
jgi:hypothetical protein